jgi:parvulin-like peptidyl-prolyl isomerase
MKIYFLLKLSFLILFFIGLAALDQDIIAQEPLKVYASTNAGTSTAQQAYVEGEILVKFTSKVSLEQIQSFNKSQNMTILEINKALGVYRLKVSKTVKAAVSIVRAQPFVDHVRPNYILAEVNDEDISLFDIEIFIENINPFLRQIYTNTEAIETLLQSLVDYKLFAKAAREKNFDQLPEAKRTIEGAKEKALAQVYQEKITESTSVSEKEIENYYKSNLKEFQIPEQILIQAILVDTRKEAEVILDTIKSGAEFDKMARERSKVMPSQFGDNPGWIGRGKMDPEFEKAAFALAKGEVSGVVKTRSGYHIIKLENRKGPGQKTLTEVRNNIEQSLRAKKQKDIIEKKKAELRKIYKTSFYTESLSEVKVQKTGKKDPRNLIRGLQEMLEGSH